MWHVLAWSNKKKVAYICPMDVLLRDIGETLRAKSISFPGGEEVYSKASPPVSLETSIPTLTALNTPDVSNGLSDLMKELRLPPTPFEIDGIPPTELDLPESEKAGKPFIPIRLVTKTSDIQLEKMPRNQLDFKSWNRDSVLLNEEVESDADRIDKAERVERGVNTV